MKIHPQKLLLIGLLTSLVGMLLGSCSTGYQFGFSRGRDSANAAAQQRLIDADNAVDVAAIAFADYVDAKKTYDDLVAKAWEPVKKGQRRNEAIEHELTDAIRAADAAQQSAIRTLLRGARAAGDRTPEKEN